MAYKEVARGLTEELVRIRHQLHQHPEIGLELPETQQVVLRELEGLPLEIVLGQTTTSVTAVLRGTAPSRGAESPVVLLRADMDALPVTEAVDVPYRSVRDGYMHACGHDMHTTMLIGAARILAQDVQNLSGDVVFMFQPGEEGWNGAGFMIEEGVLNAAGRRADAAFALHVFSGIVEHGSFFSRSGAVLAASDEVVVMVSGPGGHGSRPHITADPVSTIAAMVSGLETLVSREFDVFDPVVISVGSLVAGTKANVIPSSATFEATIRTFSREARDRVFERLPRMLRGIASARGMSLDLKFKAGYPVTVNAAPEVDFALGVVRDLFGDGAGVSIRDPLTGSEDFSRVLESVPGAFLGLGAAPIGADLSTVAYNHSPHAVFDDAVLPRGANLLAELARRRLDVGVTCKEAARAPATVTTRS